MPLLRYRAGRRALERLRRGPLEPDDIRALLAPAAGPKWLAVAGMDRAFLRSRFVRERTRRLLLVGASAGAWRSFAFAARDPLAAHERLAEAYCAQRFTRADRAPAISAAYAKLLRDVFTAEDVAHALAHPKLDLALIAVRGLIGAGSTSVPLQAGALGFAALLNAVSAATGKLFFDRTLFHTGNADNHDLLVQLQGARVPLTADNAHDVLLASGTVPLYMTPVGTPAGAVSGRYLDGGLTDYHVSQTLSTGGDGVILLFLHQGRVIPNWFDKSLPWRKPGAGMLDDVIIVYPDPAWVARLPGGAVPTREDFQKLIHEPELRTERWRTVVQRSDELGELLLSDLQHNELATQASAID